MLVSLICHTLEVVRKLLDKSARISCFGFISSAVEEYFDKLVFILCNMNILNDINCFSFEEEQY